MMTVNLFLRSLLFSCYALTSIIIHSVICLCLWPFPLSCRAKATRGFLSSYLYVLKILCHINYEITGLENIPHDRKGIVLCKHQSAWETFLLPLIFHNPAVIVKRELLWVPCFGWGLATQDPIAINRSDTSSAMQQVITKGRQCLKQGRWIIVFPEGTRIASGKVGKYHLGGARLAVATGYPVIPVAHNAGLFWPRRRFIKRPGTVQVVIGVPIESQDRTPEEVMELAKTWIENVMARIDKA